MRFLPHLNACLNTLSAIFLTTGFIAILQKRVSIHQACMKIAFGLSSLFLGSYLYYHFHVGSQPYTGTGFSRTLYFLILGTHSVLAMLIVPLVLRQFYLASKGRWETHRALGRWTLPMWLYVSVTGVIIYLFLYT